MTFFIFGCHGD